MYMYNKLTFTESKDTSKHCFHFQIYPLSNVCTLGKELYALFSKRLFLISMLIGINFIHTQVHMGITRLFYLVVGVFINGLDDRGSIPGQVIPKTHKWYLIHCCLTLSIIRYVSMVKWINSRKRVAPLLTPQCSRYCKRSFRVTLD